MKPEIQSRLRCPISGMTLTLDQETLTNSSSGEIESGTLVSVDRKYKYPIRKGIPRFVPDSNYADNFGMQWNHFAKTQLDSYSGHSISSDRFWRATRWTPEELKDKWILDVGCGSGRFTEIALKSGAQVVALDYSNAVDACYANLKQYKNLHVVQGDIYALPFVSESFNFVYCLGVLQHCPDVERAFFALPRMVSSDGGKLVAECYLRSWNAYLRPYYWLRPITTRIPDDKLFAFLVRVVPPLLELSRLLGRIPIIGNTAKRIIPVANDESVFPLSKKQLIEWSLLDTFDWLAPKYDKPQTIKTFRDWFIRAGLTEIEVKKIILLTGSGIKK